jgi:hypothetical protein
MSIPVVRLAPTSQWDQNVLNQLFDNKLFPTGYEFTNHERIGELPKESDMHGCILLIPGRYWHDRTDEINDYVNQFSWVLAIRTGDEQDLFDIKRIVHRNIRWWVQTPSVGRDYGDVRKFGVGWTPHFNYGHTGLPSVLIPRPPDVGIDVFLSAQNTQPRRFEAFASMNCMPGVNMVRNETRGFTQGLAPHLYTQYMIHSRVALAPGGPESPDTFRLYEALQAHCVPVADDQSANHDSAGYWRMLFPDAPFPILDRWIDAPGIVKQALSDHPKNANRITAWWMREKRRYVNWLHEDLDQLRLTRWHEGDISPITAVVPVSPIPSHPNTVVIEETINSIRRWLPDSEIIVTFDGVRPEQESMRDDYEESIRRTLWMCDHHWRNVTPLIFDEHQHQSGMMSVALQHIRTPLLMYVEQDTPLVTDEPINWNEITANLITGRADLIRFHHESHVLDVHMHLMQERDGMLWRTTQWSQRPHVASKQFYMNAMTHLTPNARCFIEEKFASVAQQQPGWKLFLYCPDGNVKRSYHLDGRAGGPKFELSQTF